MTQLKLQAAMISDLLRETAKQFQKDNFYQFIIDSRGKSLWVFQTFSTIESSTKFILDFWHDSITHLTKTSTFIPLHAKTLAFVSLWLASFAHFQVFTAIFAPTSSSSFHFIVFSFTCTANFFHHFFFPHKNRMEIFLPSSKHEAQKTKVKQVVEREMARNWKPDN